jgi:hypothetical protein
VDIGFEPQHQIDKIIGLGTAMRPLAPLLRVQL